MVCSRLSNSVNVVTIANNSVRGYSISVLCSSQSTLEIRLIDCVLYRQVHIAIYYTSPAALFLRNIQLSFRIFSVYRFLVMPTYAPEA